MDDRFLRLPGLLPAMIVLTALIPFLFYLNFGEVGPVGWGLVIFFDTLLLLGWLLKNFPEWNRGRHDDWISGRFPPIFWLVWCVLGPFFGFFFTGVQSFPPSQTNWHWRYVARVICTVATPLLAALPMVVNLNRKLKPALAQLVVLIGITAMPVATGFNCLRDLRSGPITLREPLDCHLVDATFGVYDCNGLHLLSREITQHSNVITLLPHSGRVLKLTKE